MTYSLHPGAEHDIAKALDFYSEHADSVVADHFLEEFERIAKLLVEHPGLGTPATKGRRTFPLKVFPYCRISKSRKQHSNPDRAPSTEETRLRWRQAVGMKLSCAAGMPTPRSS